MNLSCTFWTPDSYSGLEKQPRALDKTKFSDILHLSIQDSIRKILEMAENFTELIDPL